MALFYIIMAVLLGLCLAVIPSKLYKLHEWNELKYVDSFGLNVFTGRLFKIPAETKSEAMFEVVYALLGIWGIAIMVYSVFFGIV